MTPQPPPPDVPDPAATALVRREDVGDIAWQVLLRDGDLVRLREDVALPARVVATAALRAAALAPLVPVRCVVGRGSAVWVHLGGPDPGRVQVVAPRDVRVPEPAPGRASMVADLADRDVVVLGAVRVTTPRRTAVDLLSHDPPDQALAQLARLRAAGLDLAQVRADVAQAAGRRGVRAAAALLPRLDAVPRAGDEAVRPRRPAGRPSRP
ncbi:hypothetical protein [Cellulomonas sp. Marseille-Q8402]